MQYIIVQILTMQLRAPDPFSIVPHVDTARHGTHVAGIA